MSETTPDEAAVQPKAEPETPEPFQPDKEPSTSPFPHEKPSEHWDIDFSDSKQSYEGADLPVWILAGWAAFIIWAVVYLYSGLPTAF